MNCVIYYSFISSKTTVITSFKFLVLTMYCTVHLYLLSRPLQLFKPKGSNLICSFQDHLQNNELYSGPKQLIPFMTITAIYICIFQWVFLLSIPFVKLDTVLSPNHALRYYLPSFNTITDILTHI